jgi:predicted hotdog family 3-hydroxylacyl-ACP dehydratase
MLKDHDWIAAHVPHQGSMCLLDGVLEYDDTHVRCVSRRHRDPAMPLRARGQLSAVCGIEFAAQAAAVHGALLDAARTDAPRKPCAGYIVALRAVQLHVARLDDIDAPLEACAERLGGDTATVVYALTLRALGRELLHARATIVVDPAALATVAGARS